MSIVVGKCAADHVSGTSVRLVAEAGRNIWVMAQDRAIGAGAGIEGGVQNAVEIQTGDMGLGLVHLVKSPTIMTLPSICPVPGA
jgi:hypothetical protein